MDVQVEIVIDPPVGEVASYAGDPGSAPEWYSNIASVSGQTPPPASVGSRMDFVSHFLGRTLAYTYEVVELDPNRRLVMRTADGPFPMETTYTWTEVDRRATRMTLCNRGTPAGFAKITAPMMKAGDASGDHQGPRQAQAPARVRPRRLTWPTTRTLPGGRASCSLS